MTDDPHAGALAWAPDACTLPTAQRPTRLAEFDDLFAANVHDVDRVGPKHLRLLLRGPAELEKTVADLAARENECCSFFQFTIASPDPGQVTFDIEVPPAHVDVLDALAGRARHVRGDR